MFGELGAPELILVGAIALLLAGASRLFQRQSHDSAELAPSRAYADRLLGTRRRVSRPRHSSD
jgi:hypothetical protein